MRRYLAAVAVLAAVAAIGRAEDLKEYSRRLQAGANRTASELTDQGAPKDRPWLTPKWFKIVRESIAAQGEAATSLLKKEVVGYIVEDLIDEAKSNAVAAERKHKGFFVMLDGRPEEVGRNANGVAFVRLDSFDPKHGGSIVCYFGDGHDDIVEAVDLKHPARSATFIGTWKCQNGVVSLVDCGTPTADHKVKQMERREILIAQHEKEVAERDAQRDKDDPGWREREAAEREKAEKAFRRKQKAAQVKAEKEKRKAEARKRRGR